MTRVLVVAPSAIVRAGLEALLQASPALEVVGTASKLSSVRKFEGADDEVLLVDLDGEDLVSLSDDPEILTRPSVVLLAGAEGNRAGDALRRGVRAVLPRAASGEEIIAAIAAVAAGLIVVHPDIADVLPGWWNADERLTLAPSTEHLTQREIEVLAMLAEGAANKEIARRLGISDHTVKFHVGSILSKLDAASRTEAVTIGIRRGLIML